MCGIVGFTGNHQAAPILLDGLSKLEYRGYDSAGLAVRDGEHLAQVVKAKGRLSNLSEKTDSGKALKGTCGIGHTRWATHGEPSQINAHPHVSGNCERSGSGTVESEVVGVHNGIIENYTELKEKLLKHGYTFYSDTDTEVVIKLVDYYYKKYNLGPIDAIAKTMVRVRGSYALELMFKDYPGEIWVARKDSPMIIGIADGETYVASDVPAILKYTRNVYYIGNLEFAKLVPGEAHFYDLNGDEIEKETTEIKWDAEAAEKAGFEHFMMKEIYEQPKAIRDTLNSVVKDGVIVGAEDTKMLGRQEKALDSAKVNQKAIKNARSGWSILLCQSIREYQKAIEEQVIFWIMVALAVLLIFVLLIYRVTKPVMISVNDIVDAMKNLEKDNFREKLEVKEKDSTEIQEISEGFNEMSERIHNLIGQVKESAMEQKNAEISALEAQIDPHFLYNILDTINWKAIENEQYEISEMLVALADILRYAINDAGEFTTIDAEKGWLEKYILLQQEKLGEEIELEFKIQDSYGKCKIHKMLLQPFVENAIKYSFRGYEGAHRLTIEVSKAEEQMHIIIANNGRHIEEDQLKDLNMGKEIKNHFGISNVRKRLKLYYGEDAVIYFENVSPSGVKVHLFVPLQEEQKDEDSSY